MSIVIIPRNSNELFRSNGAEIVSKIPLRIREGLRGGKIPQIIFKILGGLTFFPWYLLSGAKRWKFLVPYLCCDPENYVMRFYPYYFSEKMLEN